MNEESIDDRIRLMFVRLLPAHLPPLIDEAVKTRLGEITGVQTFIDEQMALLRAEQTRVTQGINNAIYALTKRTVGVCDMALIKHQEAISKYTQESIDHYLEEMDRYSQERLNQYRSELQSNRRWGRLEGALIGVALGACLWWYHHSD